MNIKIDEEYVLTSDPHNIILNRKRVVKEGKKKGQTVLDAIGFYPTVIQALESLLNEKVNRTTARTLSGLLREHNYLVGWLQGLFTTIKQD